MCTLKLKIPDNTGKCEDHHMACHWRHKQGSRGTVLPILNLSAVLGWVVNTMTQLLSSPERGPAPIIQDWSGWVQKLSTHPSPRYQVLDCPALWESLWNNNINSLQCYLCISSSDIYCRNFIFHNQLLIYITTISSVGLAYVQTLTTQKHDFRISLGHKR
jgi:hypothetical protein